MKKFSWIFALILALSMAFVFAGCGEEPSNPGVNDGTGPGVRYKFSSLTIPTGTLDDTALAPFHLKISGNAVVSYVDGVFKVDPNGRTEDYHCLDVLKSAWEDFDPPFEFTVKGEMVDGGALKLGQAGPTGFYGVIKAAGGALNAGDEFEITATITKSNLTGTDGIRIQSSAAPSKSFIVTEILIVK